MLRRRDWGVLIAVWLSAAEVAWAGGGGAGGGTRAVSVSAVGIISALAVGAAYFAARRK